MCEATTIDPPSDSINRDAQTHVTESTDNTTTDEPIILRGRLLLDPSRPTTIGWVRIENRRIAEIHEGDPPPGERAMGSRDHVVTPAFVDGHTHLPQIDSVGCDGLDLLDWLEHVIFPAEVWWGAGAAAHLARRATRSYIREGTCAVAGYLTSHATAARAVAARVAGETPLRTMLGRVAMDREAPDDLIREDRDRASQSPPPSPLMPAYGEKSDTKSPPTHASRSLAATSSSRRSAGISANIRARPCRRT